MTPEAQVIADLSVNLSARGIAVPSGMKRLLTMARKEGATLYQSCEERRDYGKGGWFEYGACYVTVRGTKYLSTQLTEELVRHQFVANIGSGDVWRWDSRMPWTSTFETVFKGKDLIDAWLDVTNPSLKELVTIKSLIDSGEYVCLTIRIRGVHVHVNTKMTNPYYHAHIELRPSNRSNIKLARSLVPKPRTNSSDWFSFKNVVSKQYMVAT